MQYVIDSLLIGHNESSLTKKINRISEKKNAHYENKEINEIKVKNRVYSVSELLYSYFEKHDTDLGLGAYSFNSNKYLNGAIQYIGSRLFNDGINIKYINNYNQEKNNLKELLMNHVVKSVLITTTFYTSHMPIIEIVRFIRKYNKDVKIITGGPYIYNLFINDSKKNIKSIFELMNCDVYIVNNATLDTLVDVTRRIALGRTYEDVNNIIYKSNEGLVFNALEKPKGREEYKIFWETFDLTPFKSIIFKTADSCPFKCAFCDNPQRLGEYHAYDVEFIENELNKVNLLSNIKSVRFADDTLNFPKERFKTILKMMIKNRYGFKWSSYIRSQYLDEETVKLMVESGCEGVFLGIESGSQLVLDNMNKKANINEYSRGIELLNKYNIPQLASFVVGFPGETDETVKETIKFINQNKPTFFHLWVWYCSPFSDIWKNREQYHLSGTGLKWEHSTMSSQEAMLKKYEILKNVKNSTYLPISFEDMLCLFQEGINTKNIIDFSMEINKLIDLMETGIDLDNIYKLFKNILGKERVK